MDQLQKEKHQHERRKPSFSSTLLDEIYRSIDGEEEEKEELVFYKEPMKKKQTSSVRERNNTIKSEKQQKEDQKMGNLTKSCLIEKWVEEKVVRKKYVADFNQKNLQKNQNFGSCGSMIFNSSSSSSDSCCGGGGGFSSSETESIYSSKSNPKPIRTSISVSPKISTSKTPQRRSSLFEFHQEKQRNCVPEQKSQIGNGFIKTKSRALKIYGDLKKVKQPISPGGKLATFINSLFTTGIKKKPKFPSKSSINGDHKDSKSGYTSTCSSASSFSRSCLSKTPLSSSTRVKRSVRFYPVSVIVDEDFRAIGHKCIYEDQEPGLMSSTKFTKKGEEISSPLSLSPLMKNRRSVEEARDFFKGYHETKIDYEMRDSNVNFEGEDEDEDEDEDDDAASYSSSDLFELDHLRSIGGIDRYREELPVYETTHFHANCAIANGLIL